MTFFDAAILGLIEGVTEFLPISSTGHLILASSLLGLAHTEFLKTFEIAIQLGAISAVAILYFKSFLKFNILARLIVAFLPTAVVGLALYSIIKTYLIGNELVVVTALFLGGIALIVFELLHKEDAAATAEMENISYKQALSIGLFQSIAIIPGVSRSAATIVGGLMLGLKRATIVEFSFLLAVPTMAAATGLDLLKNYRSFTEDNLAILAVGFITAFVVALIVVRFFLHFIKKHTFIPFGIYRIFVSIAFAAFLFSPLYQQPVTANSNTNTQGAYDSDTYGRYMDIETYVTQNISTISPVTEQLGGTFYITSIKSNDGQGVVEYEDGHNAYTADFAYTIEESGKPVLTSFTVRQ